MSAIAITFAGMARTSAMRTRAIPRRASRDGGD